MSFNGEHVLLRVYLLMADRSPHVPTYQRLVQAARSHGLAGATVFRGIVGLGSRGFARVSNWAMAQNVPVIVEMVDGAEKIAAFLNGPMDELMIGGMATLERAHVLIHRNGGQEGPREPVKLALPGAVAAPAEVADLNVGGRMKTQSSGIMLRVFIGESDRYESQPLYEAILQKARALGCAGATVLRGTEGFGANSVVHKASLLEMSTDLPVVIELVDSEEKVKLLLPSLEEMVTEGMITMEYVTVLLYRDRVK